METTSVTKFTYRVEPNPAGGFIARPGDPSLDAIEGATREEVQQKIQAKITEMLQSQLPTEFKLGGLNVKINRNVSVTTRTATKFNTSSPQALAPSALTQDSFEAPAPSSDTISTILRIAAGVLALLTIFYFLLRFVGAN